MSFSAAVITHRLTDAEQGICSCSVSHGDATVRMYHISVLLQLEEKGRGSGRDDRSRERDTSRRPRWVRYFEDEVLLMLHIYLFTYTLGERALHEKINPYVFTSTRTVGGVGM